MRKKNSKKVKIQDFTGKSNLLFGTLPTAHGQC
jgi:hypothetical protein